MADSSTTAVQRLLLERVERERDRAASALGAARAQAGAARAQAGQLDDYRREHDRRWSERFRVQGAPEVIGHHHTFGRRLDAALAQQGRTVATLDDRVERARRELVERERRVAVVRRLIERREHDARQAAERREQRASDEFAQRAGRRPAPLRPDPTPPER